MYAAAGFAAVGATWPHAFADACVWVAVAAWALVAGAALRHALRREPVPAPARREMRL